MTTYDVMTNYEKDKAEMLYNFLKTAKCSDLGGSNLLLTCIYDSRPPAKAYRIQVDSKNRHKYLYSLNKYDTVVTPVELNAFMERTLKL
jgi:hypothetical protein